MYIDGQWTNGSGETRITVTNPATEAVLGSVPDGTAEDANKALTAAKKAQKAWERTPPVERARYVRTLCDLLEKNREDLARLITLEQGKPLAQAKGEVGGAIAFMSFAADSARSIEGDIIPSDAADEDIWIRKAPVGVVVGLTAWNFPVALAGRKLGPALVAGNTIVLKSHEFTPLSVIRFAELCEEASIPPGVVNIVSGTGRGIGEALVKNPLANLVTLTGSVRAGREIFAAGADSLKLLRLELGGKAPFIVMEDGDVDAAVDAAITARFTNCGQVCTCLERLYLHKDIKAAFLEKFIARVDQLKIGNPLEDVDLGPKVSRAEADKVNAMIKAALEEGATLLNSPASLEGETFQNGHWVAPTVLEVTHADQAIMKEEIFGPVVPVMEISSFEEALDLANASDFGLSAYLFSRDINRVMRFVRQSEFGELYINRGSGEAPQAFHTGWKASGLGGEDGKYGLDGYLRKKTVYLKTS